MNRIVAIAAVLRWNYEPAGPAPDDDGDYEFVALAILGALSECERATRTEEVDAVFAKLRNPKVSSPDASARADGEGFGTPLAGGDSSAADLSTAAAAEEVPTTPISSPAAPTPGEDAAAPEPLPLGSGAAAPIDDDDLDGRRLFWCGADGCGDGYNRLGDLQTHALDEHGRYDLTTVEKRRRPRPSAA